VKVSSEVDALRRQIAELQGVKERCWQAEKMLMATEARNRLLGDNAPLGIFVVDREGRITGYNRKMEEMVVWQSVRRRESTDLSGGQILVPTDLVFDIEQCIMKQQLHIAEHSYIDGQGGTVYLRYSLSPIPDNDGIVSEVMAIVENFTDLKRIEKELIQSERRYRLLYHSSPIAMIERDVTLLQAHLKKLREEGVLDLRSYLQENPQHVYQCWSLITTIDHNPAFWELMDLQAGTQSADELTLPDTEVFLEMAREIILVIAAGSTMNERELEVVTVKGRKKFVLGKSMVVSDSDENSDRVVVALVDITERKKAEETLRESELRFKDQSLRDDLTGLFNQRHLYQSLAELIENAKANDTPVSLIFMDLDHFKRIVDTYGHLNGSRAIREVARTIDGCLQAPAYGVAYAGDEFVVVLPGYEQDLAVRKAIEIRSRMGDTIYKLDRNVAVRLAASFGVATFPGNAGDVESLVSAADQALFLVKESGKNGVGVYRKSN
jgi:diguanylate cyclase (GGDEF)-like protein/PAS domain S-box-containing protein